MNTLDLGLVGNGTMASLIDEKGDVVWMCVPRVDGDPAFCTLLNDKTDENSFGFFSIEIVNFDRSEQEYLVNTPVLVTRLFDTDGGCIEITDVHPRFQQFGRIFCPMMLVRKVQRIVETDWKDVSPPPKALGKNAFITGLVTINEELIQLLDLELLLAKVYPESLSSKDVLLNDMEVETLRGLSILLVDDSIVARKQLSDVLDRKNIGYQVTHDGSDAMARILAAQTSGKPIDLLVSDIEMPGLDGYELAFQIRNHPGLHQPWIILHSSLSSEMSVSYAEQVGANRALTKFDAHELLHTMLDAAAGRALE